MHQVWVLRFCQCVQSDCTSLSAVIVLDAGVANPNDVIVLDAGVANPNDVSVLDAAVAGARGW